MTGDWRDDPNWRLAYYDASAFDGKIPSHRPDDDAELAQPPLYATTYRGGVPVAHWDRLDRRLDTRIGAV